MRQQLRAGAAGQAFRAAAGRESDELESLAKRSVGLAKARFWAPFFRSLPANQCVQHGRDECRFSL